ncbi:anthranilate phosphoribosyltransferase [Salsuginibacillus kocurii]|uniref:anthranilate phosphoribosyltransferase n=1 Tax=Salsuginibacillus kocurii TaxID=427078 RepID=UPI0003819494|nr:hypothetical protein [Salsuginibacillus kocurii]
MEEWIKAIGRGKKGSRDLSYSEARTAAEAFANEQWTDVQAGAFFSLMRMKEATGAELQAFAEVFREHTQVLPLPSPNGLDCAGPFDGRHRFAATIPAAFVSAAAGLPVTLQGSRTLPPKYGTPLEVILEACGIDPAQTQDGCAVTYVNLETRCAPLKKLRHVREQLGVRTFINTIEKTLCPTQGNTLLLGAFHKTAIERMTPMLQTLPYEKVIVFQGDEGSEDLPVDRTASFAYVITSAEVRQLTFRLDETGVSKQTISKEPITAEQQASITEQILGGKKNADIQPYREQVVYNAGIRHFLLNRVSSVTAGIDEARRLLDDGEPYRLFSNLKRKKEVVG